MLIGTSCGRYGGVIGEDLGPAFGRRGGGGCSFSPVSFDGRSLIWRPAIGDQGRTVGHTFDPQQASSSRARRRTRSHINVQMLTIVVFVVIAVKVYVHVYIMYDERCTIMLESVVCRHFATAIALMPMASTATLAPVRPRLTLHLRFAKSAASCRREARAVGTPVGRPMRVHEATENEHGRSK